MSTAKDDILEVGMTASEFIMDESQKKFAEKFFGDDFGDLAELTNATRTIMAGAKIFQKYKESSRLKRLLAFLGTLKDDEQAWTAFQSLEDGDKELIRSFVIRRLDQMESETQASALTCAVSAFLRKKIPQRVFFGLAHELVSINPLVFDFKKNLYKIARDKELYRVEGEASYLPRAFNSQHIPAAITFGQPPMYINELGQAFFDHVYRPMYEKIKQ